MSSAFGGGTRSPAYGATKAGILAITQHVAARYGKQGIRCNAVVPGLIVTEYVEEHVPREWRDVMHRQECVDHIGRPEDIANAVAFLVSDDPAFITGTHLMVDGGQTCHRPSLADELDGITQVPK